MRSSEFNMSNNMPAKDPPLVALTIRIDIKRRIERRIERGPGDSSYITLWKTLLEAALEPVADGWFLIMETSHLGDLGVYVQHSLQEDRKLVAVLKVSDPSQGRERALSEVKAFMEDRLQKDSLPAVWGIGAVGFQWTLLKQTAENRNVEVVVD